MEAATDGTTLVCTWGRPKPVRFESVNWAFNFITFDFGTDVIIRRI